MHSFLITLVNDIAQTGILFFSLFTELSSVLNLNLIKLPPKIKFHLQIHQPKKIFHLLVV